jgi:hypothetical protein
MKQKLINHIHEEHKEYLEHIEQLSPKEIISKAYEICYREEFISIIEGSILSDETIEVLLNIPHIIDVLYDEWLKTDGSVCDMLTDVIINFVEEELK